MLQGGAQLVEGGFDVRALQCGLRLDEVGDLVGLNELLVVHGLRIVLVVGLREAVVVLCLNVLLTHFD